VKSDIFLTEGNCLWLSRNDINYNRSQSISVDIVERLVKIYDRSFVIEL
jgi:hypothetical protein